MKLDTKYSMSFTENLYLKQQLKKLQEENLKLKQILSEAQEGTPPASDVMGGTKNKFVKPLAKLTREEAFNLGVQHAKEHGGVKTPPHYFYDNNFVAGFNSVK